MHDDTSQELICKKDNGVTRFLIIGQCEFRSESNIESPVCTCRTCMCYVSYLCVVYACVLRRLCVRVVLCMSCTPVCRVACVYVCTCLCVRVVFMHVVTTCVHAFVRLSACVHVCDYACVSISASIYSTCCPRVAVLVLWES